MYDVNKKIPLTNAFLSLSLRYFSYFAIKYSSDTELLRLKPILSG